jgi:hypothetical protein
LASGGTRSGARSSTGSRSSTPVRTAMSRRGTGSSSSTPTGRASSTASRRAKRCAAATRARTSTACSPGRSTSSTPAEPTSRGGRATRWSLRRRARRRGRPSCRRGSPDAAGRPPGRLRQRTAGTTPSASTSSGSPPQPTAVPIRCRTGSTAARAPNLARADRQHDPLLTSSRGRRLRNQAQLSDLQGFWHQVEPRSLGAYAEPF